ncbi:hypothetical protein, partial [uncultured Akkermansia sp.]|uniref:hypothetical protein n=1 Tax=uncultured Akkermansia sp. TaxID=512294 RepID=UPI0026333397
MVGRELPKLETWVRFPSPVPVLYCKLFFIKTCGFLFLWNGNIHGNAWKQIFKTLRPQAENMLYLQRSLFSYE